tara:strand:+ start:260 stop:541 length:282 start_codon:yes stop_codon:yes gene_type:complete
MNSEINYKENDMIGTRDRLITRLTEGKLNVTFTKKNGEERTMFCTLMSEFLPETKETEKKDQKVNEEVLAVWDLDKDAWRSFRIDSISNVQTA